MGKHGETAKTLGTSCEVQNLLPQYILVTTFLNFIVENIY